MAALHNTGFRTAGRIIVLAALGWFAATGSTVRAALLFEPVEGALAPTLGEADRHLPVHPDAYILSALTVGQTLSVVLPGVGTFDYVVRRRSSGPSLVRVEAYLVSDSSRRLTVAVRPQAVAGFIDTPAGTYTLAHVNGMHWVGLARHDDADRTMAMSLWAQNATGLKIR